MSSKLPRHDGFNPMQIKMGLIVRMNKNGTIRSVLGGTGSMAKTAAWTRKEGKNPKGGLNAKGRASYKGGTLKAPVKAGDNPRRASFLARMGGMPGPERKPDGSPTRLLLSLQAWGASSKADAKSKAAAISKRNKGKK